MCPFCESAPAFSLTDTGDSNITLKLKVARAEGWMSGILLRMFMFQTPVVMWQTPVYLDRYRGIDVSRMSIILDVK